MSIIRKHIFSLVPYKHIQLVRQSGRYDCGLACISMISNYYGKKLDLEDLHRSHAVPVDGLSIRNLLVIGRANNITLTPIKVKLSQLSIETGPLILLWNNNHYVVLENINDKHLMIHDPAVGSRAIAREVAIENYSNVAIRAVPSFGVDSQHIRKLKLFDLIKEQNGFKKSVFILVLFTVAHQIVSAVQPLFVQYVIDEIILNDNSEILSFLVFAFVLLTLVQLSVSLTRQLFILAISSKLRLTINTEVLSHLLKLPYSYFIHRNTGDILQSYSALSIIQSTIYRDVPALFIDSIMLLTCLSIMLVYSSYLTLVTIAFSLIILAIKYHYYFKTQVLTERLHSEIGKVSSIFIESVRNFRTISLFQIRDSRISKWTEEFKNSLATSIQLEKIGVISTCSRDLLTKLDLIVTVCLGALLILDDKFSPGRLISFLAFKAILFSSLVTLIEALINLKLLQVHLNRVSDIVLEKSEDQLDDEIHEVNQGQTREANYKVDRIEVVNLGFRYSSKDVYLFRNVNFSIDFGSKVAIAGASGTGKTTLLSCLMGVLIPTEGDILLNGTSIFNNREFKNRRSAVLQDDVLLSGSILENICSFDPNPEMGRIYSSATIANIHDEILALPSGYETKILDLGNTLSGGQKQRVFLARAIYRNPSFLYLDEATSQLDQLNDQVISRNIRSLNCTQIYVSHRTEMVSSADVIINMEDLRSVT